MSCEKKYIAHFPEFHDSLSEDKSCEFFSRQLNFGLIFFSEHTNSKIRTNIHIMFCEG